MPSVLSNHLYLSKLSFNKKFYLGRGIDVPETDGVIIAGGEQMSVQVRVPRQAVALG